MAKYRRVDPNLNLPAWITGVKTSTKSLLVLVVEYDSLVGKDELEELIEKSRELGGPLVADFYTLAPSKISLL